MMLPRSEADYLFGLTSSTNTEPSPSEKGSPTIDFATLRTKLDWKNDKKHTLLVAGGAMLAVVIAVVIPRRPGEEQSHPGPCKHGGKDVAGP
jgi:hypothetical protein